MEMKGADGERVISKGNIITSSWRPVGGGRGEYGGVEEHLKVITHP